MNQPDGFITFFYNREQPLVEPPIKPDDLTAALIGGVDLGLSIALIELCEGNVESHKRMAVRAFHALDEQSGEFHVQRAHYWAELRGEALAVYADTLRQRSN